MDAIKWVANRMPKTEDTQLSVMSLDQQRYRFAVRLNGQRWELDLTQPDPAIPRDLVDIILTVVDVYPYLLYC